MPAEVVDSGIGAMAVMPSDGAAPASLLVSATHHVYSAPIARARHALSWVDADPFSQLRGQGVVEALHYSADFLQAYACSGNQMFVASSPRDPANNTWQATMLANAAPVAIMCSAMTSGGLAAGASPLVALATNVGIYFSLDGTSFNAAKSLDVSPNANAVMIAGDMAPVLFVGGGFGVASQALPSIASNSNWTASNGPTVLPASGANGRLNNANVTDITVMGTTIYAAVASEQYADVLVSTDAGATWSATGLTQVAGGLVDIAALASDSTNRVAYAGTGGGLYALAAGVWTPVLAAGNTSLGIVQSLARDGSRLYVGTDAGAYSLALGASPATAVAARAGLDMLRVSALLATGGKVYAGTQDINTGYGLSLGGAIRYSGIPSWTDFASGSVGTHRVNSLALAGTTLLAGMRGELVSAATPGGSWSDSSLGIRDPTDPSRVVTSLYSDGTTVFAATGTNGIFSAPVASVGSGFMWMPFNGGGDQALPALGVNQLRADGTLLYAATAGGLATFDGVVPVVMPPPAPGTMPPAVDQGGGGGGALDFWSLLGLALLVCLLAAVGKSSREARLTRRGPRIRGVSGDFQIAYQGPLSVESTGPRSTYRPCGRRRTACPGQKS